MAAFRNHKLTLDNRIAEKTFEASYGRYLNVALLHLQGRKQPRQASSWWSHVDGINGSTRAVASAMAKRSQAMDRSMPKSRLECCLALKNFLEFAVAEHRQPQSVPDLREGLSEDPRCRFQEQKKAVLTDAEVSWS